MIGMRTQSLTTKDIPLLPLRPPTWIKVYLNVSLLVVSITRRSRRICKCSHSLSEQMAPAPTV